MLDGISLLLLLSSGLASCWKRYLGSATSFLRERDHQVLATHAVIALYQASIRDMVAVN